MTRFIRPKATLRFDAHSVNRIGADVVELRSTIKSLAERAADASEGTFQLEWYKLHRQHELELNKATLSYEHERLRILAYLNGGAAAAFVTLLGSIWKDSTRPNIVSFAALALWIGGLVVAWHAWKHAHNGQSAYTQAYHKRRRGEECRQANHARARSGVTSSFAPGASDSPESLGREANEKAANGQILMQAAWEWATWSVAMFALGTIAAFASIGLDSSDQAASAQTQWSKIFDLQEKLLAERDLHIRQLQQEMGTQRESSTSSVDSCVSMQE